MSRVIFIFIAIFAVLALITGCEEAPTAAPAAAVPPTSSDSQAYPPVVSAPADQSGYPAQANPPANSAYPAPGGNSLQIIASNGQATTMLLADLNALPKSSVGSESGPKVSDVIKLGGISDFATLAFTGSNGSITLTKDKVTDQVILSLANNTITLVLNGTPQEQWIKDVSGITVN